MKTDTIAEFDARLKDLHIRGQWSFVAGKEERTDGPRPMGAPHLWKWSDLRAALSEASDVIAETFTARRSLVLLNPGLSAPSTTPTFAVGIQLVKAGELAWAHRHTMAAIRFGIEGSQRLATVVDGERQVMQPGDLILTPSLSWHDHQNEGDGDGIWLDVIDLGLVATIGQRWSDPFGEAQQPMCEPANVGLRYPWDEVAALLEESGDDPGSPYDGLRLEYVNPITGGPTLPTLGCFVQSLAPGLETKSHRHTSATTYFVVKGSGATVVGEHELRWSDRDVFVVPTWMPHHHANASASEPAILFSVSDEPLLRAIGLYREDPPPESTSPSPPPVPANAARKVRKA